MFSLNDANNRHVRSGSFRRHVAVFAPDAWRKQFAREQLYLSSAIEPDQQFYFNIDVYFNIISGLIEFV